MKHHSNQFDAKFHAAMSCHALDETHELPFLFCFAEKKQRTRKIPKNGGLDMLCCACDVSEWERKRGRERGEKRRHEEQIRDC